MKTKEIIIPEGWEIDMKESGNGKVVLRDVIQEVEKPKAKTWIEVQQITGMNGSVQYFIRGGNHVGEFKMCNNSIDISHDHLPTRRDAEKVLALCQMYILADYYNREYADGWVADWESIEQMKFLPYWDGCSNEIGIARFVSHSDVRPVFASESILMECYKNNQQIFETALKP